MKWRRGSVTEWMEWMKILGTWMVVLMFMVWQHVQSRHLERRLASLRKEEDQMIFQNSRMQSQINQFISPSHLDTMARKELNMVPLDAQHRVGVEVP
jgi:cell division protein FtsL